MSRIKIHFRFDSWKDFVKWQKKHKIPSNQFILIEVALMEEVPNE